MSDVIEVTTLNELRPILTENDVVVIDFAAPAWCGPCIKFAPHFKAAAERSNATFVHVDVDQSPELVAEFNILGVPTVLGFKDAALTATIESRTAIPLLREIEAL